MRTNQDNYIHKPYGLKIETVSEEKIRELTINALDQHKFEPNETWIKQIEQNFNGLYMNNEQLFHEIKNYVKNVLTISPEVELQNILSSLLIKYNVYSEENCKNLTTHFQDQANRCPLNYNHIEKAISHFQADLKQQIIKEKEAKYLDIESINLTTRDKYIQLILKDGSKTLLPNIGIYEEVSNFIQEAFQNNIKIQINLVLGATLKKGKLEISRMVSEINLQLKNMEKVCSKIIPEDTPVPVIPIYTKSV